jgi:hypothetical protein
MVCELRGAVLTGRWARQVNLDLTRAVVIYAFRELSVHDRTQERGAA